MKKRTVVENAAMDLKGLEHMLLHVSASQYVHEEGDKEMFRLFAEDLERIRKSLEAILR